jgi:hypothetical protein
VEFDVRWLGLRPNPRMQPTGRGGPEFPAGAALLGASQWNVSLYGRGPDGLQLMRKSLGRLQPLQSEGQSQSICHLFHQAS